MADKRPVAKPVATIPDSRVQFDAIIARLDEMQEQLDKIAGHLNSLFNEMSRTRNAIGTSEATIKASVVNTGLSVIKELTPTQKRSWWQRMIGA